MSLNNKINQRFGKIDLKDYIDHLSMQKISVIYQIDIRI